MVKKNMPETEQLISEYKATIEFLSKELIQSYEIINRLNALSNKYFWLFKEQEKINIFQVKLLPQERISKTA